MGNLTRDDNARTVIGATDSVSGSAEDLIKDATTNGLQVHIVGSDAGISDVNTSFDHGRNSDVDTANTSKKFNLQLSVETADYANNEVVPDTTNDYAIETTTGTWAQYTSFKSAHTIDASAIGLAVGKPLAIRIRRLDASADEIAGEVVIEGAVIQYVADKLGGAT